MNPSFFLSDPQGSTLQEPEHGHVEPDHDPNQDERRRSQVGFLYLTKKAIVNVFSLTYFNRLMEKCEKITHKMETMVEDLTNGNKTRMELTEQPKSLNKDFKLTGYQMIG